MGPLAAVLAWLLAVAGLGVGTPAADGADVTTAALPPPAVVGGGHPATERSVSIVGDSILLGAVDQVRSTLTASGWDPTIATFPGLPLSVGAQVLAEQQAAGELGDIVVIHLGNNLPTNVAGFVHDLDATMAMLQDVPFVVWINIQTFESSRIQVDAELQAATQRWPNLQLLDWNAAVAVHPDWTGGTNPHLSVAGRIGMAHLIDDRLDQIRHSGARCRAEVNPPATATPGSGHGGWLLDATGRVHALGGAPNYGDLFTVGAPGRPTPVSIVATPTGAGYWITAADGSVFSFGDAAYAGGPPAGARA
jgi:hypothetical protein